MKNSDLFAKALVLTLALLSFSAHARRESSAKFGLEGTQYIEAVTEGEYCDPLTDVLVTDDLPGDERFITKCNGESIGWVEKVIDGKDLYYRGAAIDDSFDVDLHTPHRATPKHKRNMWADPMSYMNIYACDRDRMDDLVADMRTKADMNAPQVDGRLLFFKRQGVKFRVQLFFNMWTLSGKCIGDIREVVN